MGTQYIPDIKLFSRILKIMLTNHSDFSGALQGIGVVSIGNTDFRAFSQKEVDLTREARLILFLSFLSKNNAVRNDMNAGHWCATTDNFELRYHNFEIDNDNIAVFDGYILQSTAGGYSMNIHRFYRPSYVPSPMNFEIDKDLFSSLLQLKTKNPQVFNKIIGATELFSDSYYNSTTISSNARILCQMGALEMLLSLPKRGQRKAFKDIIETQVKLAGERKIVNYYETRWGKQKELLTIKGIWGDKFYTLRNHIIHGGKILKGEYIFRRSQHHVHIAMLFFVFFIKQEINKALGRTIFSQRIIREKHKIGYDDTEKNIFIYESL